MEVGVGVVGHAQQDDAGGGAAVARLGAAAVALSWWLWRQLALCVTVAPCPVGAVQGAWLVLLGLFVRGHAHDHGLVHAHDHVLVHVRLGRQPCEQVVRENLDQAPSPPELMRCCEAWRGDGLRGCAPHLARSCNCGVGKEVGGGPVYFGQGWWVGGGDGKESGGGCQEDAVLG